MKEIISEIEEEVKGIIPLKAEKVGNEDISKSSDDESKLCSSDESEKEDIKKPTSTTTTRFYPQVYKEIDLLFTNELLRDEYFISPGVFVPNIIEDVINDFKL